MDYRQLPHEGIRSLKPYIPGKSIASLAMEKGLTDIIKLASNENPLGCSPKVRQALAEMPAEIIAGYPSPLIHPLMANLAAHLNLPCEQLVISNGSDVIYGLLLNSFALHRGKHLLTHDYAFSTYAIQARSLGIETRSTPVDGNWLPDIDKMISACNEHTGLICLANPNNPTGCLLPGKDLKRLLESIPEQCLLVLDEAYYEFSKRMQDYEALDWLKEHPNLVITRTFSKIYGIAGLRLGYAMANPQIIEILRRLQLPFFVNQAALTAGDAALSDQGFIYETLKLNAAGMEQMAAGLHQLNRPFIPSAGNFISFDCGQDGQDVYDYLLERGIIVRPLHPYGMNNYLRVSIGTQEQNTRFLKALGGFYSC